MKYPRWLDGRSCLVLSLAQPMRIHPGHTPRTTPHSTTHMTPTINTRTAPLHPPPPPSTLQIRIADFGMSRLGSGSGAIKLSGVAGTPAYLAPEMVSHSQDTCIDQEAATKVTNYLHS
jgi:serine/threonine protein kinase